MNWSMTMAAAETEALVAMEKQVATIRRRQTGTANNQLKGMMAQW